MVTCATAADTANFRVCAHGNIDSDTTDDEWHMDEDRIMVSDVNDVTTP